MVKIPFIKEAVKSFFQSPVTQMHPHVRAEAPKDFRGKIKFNPDLCVDCGMCIRVCSTDAILKTVKNVEDYQEITFTFDLGSCTFCKMCADFCAKKSIEFTQEYSLIGTAQDKGALSVAGTFTKKLSPKPAPKAVPAAAPSTTDTKEEK